MVGADIPTNLAGPLRLGWFTNSFPVSSEPFIELQAAELINRGHDLQVFGLSNLSLSQSSSSERVRTLLQGRVANAQWPHAPVARMAAAASATLRTAQRVGIAKLPILRPLAFRRTWLDLSAVFQGEVVAGQQPFDIMHCQFGTLGEHVIKLMDAGLLSGRLVIHFRGYDITEVVRSFGPTVYDHLWGRADRFIANCETFRSIAIGLGCPEGKIEVVGSGIELANFRYRPPLALGDGAVRLVAVGRMTRRKGFHTLIAALAELATTMPDVQLTLIGDGEERQNLQRLAVDSGIAGKVRFTGALTHADISARLADSHIFVAPSETSANGGMDAPTNTIKEAMAVGVPVCATRHGGIPELVEDGVTGMLAHEADPHDLCRAIERLLEAAPSWPDLARNARKRVEDRYEIGAITERLLQCYGRAMEARR